MVTMLAINGSMAAFASWKTATHAANVKSGPPKRARLRRPSARFQSDHARPAPLLPAWAWPKVVSCSRRALKKGSAPTSNGSRPQFAKSSKRGVNVLFL